MYFVGIDLAWSQKNPTSICISKLINENCSKVIKIENNLYDSNDIVNVVIKNINNYPCFIGIDAPLIVKNEFGTRLADREVSKFFRKYNALAYPINRKILERYGEIRGENLIKMFSKYKFDINPYIKPKELSRKVLEIITQPAIVVLFKLPKILEYKPKKGRSRSYRISELKKYRDLLKNLSKFEPSLNIPEYIFRIKFEELNAKELKKYENMLDSIICSYIVFYYWYWGLEKCKIFGDVENSYIICPIKV